MKQTEDKKVLAFHLAGLSDSEICIIQRFRAGADLLIAHGDNGEVKISEVIVNQTIYNEL
jgi:hypothetical protein